MVYGSQNEFVDHVTSLSIHSAHAQSWAKWPSTTDYRICGSENCCSFATCLIQRSTMTEIRHFTKWDYLVFAATLTLSAIIGIYSALSGGRQSTADEVLLGNRRLNPIPVGLSIIASLVSAIGIIGIPSEVYVYNTMYGWIIVSDLVTYFFIAVLLLPIYTKLKITSINEVMIPIYKRFVSYFGI